MDNESEQARPPGREQQLIVVREPARGDEEGTIEEPAKLLRIASMVRQLLEEVHHASPDEAGRKRLQEIYERSLSELQEVLSEDLRRELSALAVPLEGVPSESEIRVAQAQLVGWLEGLFHGMQAAIWAQQMQARAQFEELRRRALPGGGPSPGGQRPPAGGAGGEERPDYRYL